MLLAQIAAEILLQKGLPGATVQGNLFLSKDCSGKLETAPDLKANDTINKSECSVIIIIFAKDTLEFFKFSKYYAKKETH